MGGQNLSPKERSRDWIGVLMNSSFGYCTYHHDLRSNEMNVFCVDCALRMCRHCKEAHSLHRRFQIYKYSYQDVFRHAELQKYFDCSKIQTYISNNERIVHLKPRPSITKSKSADLSPDSKYKETGIATRPKSGGTCEECGKHLQDERNRFCSITCKVTAMFRFNVYILWSTCISFVDSSHVQLLDLSASSGDPIPRSKSMFTKPPKC
ncbi:hypothetical protein AAZV13_05G206900 [Glycine max]